MNTIGNTISKPRRLAAFRERQFRRSQTAATRAAFFQRFEELFERDLSRHSPEWLLREEEKLTRLRLALFGCAPK